MSKPSGLYLFRGGETWRNPFEDYRALRDQDPVHEVNHPECGRFGSCRGSSTCSTQCETPLLTPPPRG